jgi:hypothetical protein
MEISFKLKTILIGIAMHALVNFCVIGACNATEDSSIRLLIDSDSPIAGAQTREDYLLTSTFILALSREKMDSVISIIAQSGNDVPNPYSVTDIYLCFKATPCEVIGAIEKSNNNFKEQMRNDIVAYKTDNEIDDNKGIFWGIDTCNTIKELYNVVMKKAPLISIRPLDEIMKTPGTFYSRNFREEALNKLAATDILRTFSQNISFNIMTSIGRVIDVSNGIKKSAKEKDIAAILQQALEYAIEQKDILISCTRIAQYLRDRSIISNSIDINTVFPEMMVSLAGEHDVLQDNALSEIILAEVASPSSSCCCC